MARGQAGRRLIIVRFSNVLTEFTITSFSTFQANLWTW